MPLLTSPASPRPAEVFVRELPKEDALVRRSLYDGTIYLLPASVASLAMVQSVWDAAEKMFEGDPRTAQFRFNDAEFFTRTGQLRKQFYTDPRSHAMMAHVVEAAGVDTNELACDPPRLRSILHDGHHQEAAAAMYYGHRDTWYGNSQAMITWWIPLHDVAAEETFGFYPSEYDRPVANDSEIFDYDAWTTGGAAKRIGWQSRDTGLTARYPQLLEEPQGPAVPVVAERGDVLLFAAQHLHRTRPNSTGRTRLSLDFRSVHLSDDGAGCVATNVDNRSIGSSLPSFVRLKDVEAT